MTSATIFTGDAVMVNFSLTTSSGTASVWTVQGNASDGLQTAIDATQWQSIKTVGAQGYYSLDTIPRFAQIQRTPSASSTSMVFSVTVGP